MNRSGGIALYWCKFSVFLYYYGNMNYILKYWSVKILLCNSFYSLQSMENTAPIQNKAEFFKQNIDKLFMAEINKSERILKERKPSN